MRHSLSLVVFGLAALAASAPARSEPALKTTSVEIPQGGPTFPGGAKADAVNTHCLICHSAEMVLDQPALPKAEWEKEVAKMRKVYGAPLQDQDIPAIVDYLAALKPGG